MDDDMKWENQFASVEKPELLRTTVEIPHTLNALIKSYEPKTGVLQNTISILLTKLSDELRKSTILTGDRYAYQRALAECRIELGGIQRSTAEQPSTGNEHSSAGKAVSRNDNGGIAKVARKTKRPSKSHDAASTCGSVGGDNDQGSKKT